MSTKGGYIRRKIISIAQKIYESIPLYLRVAISPYILFFKTLRYELWIVQGEEKCSNLPISVLISCHDPDKNFLLNLIYGDSSNYNEYCIGNAWQWDIPQKIKKYGNDCSIIFVDVANSQDNLLPEANWFYIPRWVLGEVNIPCGPEIVKNGSLKRDLRRIQKNALQFEITKDSHIFNEFYYNMYIPYIIGSHGKSAFIDSYKTLWDNFRSGELLLVKKQDTFVAGSMIIYEKDGPHLFRNGILNGNRNYINDGAMAALYHFPFIYLSEKGFKKVNLGPSRPFLHDGVLRFKKKWSLKISGSYLNGSFALKVLSDSPATRCFLQNNPFIFESNGFLYGATFADNNEPLSLEEIKLIKKDLFSPGMAKLFIYCFGKDDVTKQGILPPEFPAHIELRSAADIFKMILWTLAISFAYGWGSLNLEHLCL
jgi:hypothetical protein